MVPATQTKRYKYKGGPRSTFSPHNTMSNICNTEPSYRNIMSKTPNSLHYMMTSCQKLPRTPSNGQVVNSGLMTRQFTNLQTDLIIVVIIISCQSVIRILSYQSWSTTAMTKQTLSIVSGVTSNTKASLYIGFSVFFLTAVFFFLIRFPRLIRDTLTYGSVKTHKCRHK